MPPEEKFVLTAALVRPTSVICKRATSIFESWFSMISIRTCCKFAADEIGDHLKLKPEGKQNIHVATMRLSRQDFKQWAMSFGASRVFGVRGHFDSNHGVDCLPARRGEAVAESFVADCREPNAGKSYS